MSCLTFYKIVTNPKALHRITIKIHKLRNEIKKNKLLGPEFLLPRLQGLSVRRQLACGQSTSSQSQPNEEVESGQPEKKYNFVQELTTISKTV